MEQDLDATSGYRSGILDDVLRWLTNNERCPSKTRLHLPLRVCVRYMVCLQFPTSNNVAEYEALINGLRIAIELGI
jgi:hypothetical protein